MENSKENDKEINQFLSKIKEMPDFGKVKFIILFGSRADGKSSNLSDYDFAIYFDGREEERFKFRLKLLSKLSDKFDIKIFQDLPLYVQKEILKGKLIYALDISFVYDVAYETIKKFEYFEYHLKDYIQRRKELRVL